MSLKAILAAKGGEVVSVDSFADLAAATKLLTKRRIGAPPPTIKFVNASVWYLLNKVIQEEPNAGSDPTTLGLHGTTTSIMVVGAML